jgi:hypothetical protein
LDTQAKLAAAQARAAAALGKGKGTKDQSKQYVVCEVKRIRVIPPGLYRINKPWEMGDPTHLVGCGLLAKLGLNPIERITVSKAVPLTSNP